MTIDRRLREGFDRITSEIEPDVSGYLARVERSAARRRTVRRIGAGLGVAAAVLALVFAAPRVIDSFRTPVRPASPPATVDPSVIAGSYGATVPPGAGIVRRDNLAGPWRMQLADNGVMDLVGPPSFTGISRGFQFRLLEGGRFQTSVFATDLCSSMPPGEYAWSLRGSRLTLTPIADACAARVAVLSSAPWSAG
jgi:hypothetical protein